MSRKAGLDILAEAALRMQCEDAKDVDSSGESTISPALAAALPFPMTVRPTNAVHVSGHLSNTLPYNLTSNESIQIMAQKELQKIMIFAERECKAIEKFTVKQLRDRSLKRSHHNRTLIMIL